MEIAHPGGKSTIAENKTKTLKPNVNNWCSFLKFHPLLKHMETVAHSPFGAISRFTWGCPTQVQSGKVFFCF
jgi:hypothetical protein